MQKFHQIRINTTINKLHIHDYHVNSLFSSEVKPELFKMGFLLLIQYIYEFFCAWMIS